MITVYLSDENEQIANGIEIYAKNTLMKYYDLAIEFKDKAMCALIKYYDNHTSIEVYERTVSLDPPKLIMSGNLRNEQAVFCTAEQKEELERLYHIGYLINLMIFREKNNRVKDRLDMQALEAGENALDYVPFDEKGFITYGVEDGRPMVACLTDDGKIVRRIRYYM